MVLSEKFSRKYIAAEKGYQGEVLFDQMMQNLSIEHLIINDLLFEVGNTHFQIDSLLIKQNKIHLFDVKNFEGDYYLEGEKLVTKSGTEIKNPLLQLQRSESLFRQLLQQLSVNFQVEASLVFVNPDFYLYQAPLDLPVIFPSQIKRFLDNLNMRPSKLSGKHHRLSEQLVPLHIEKSPFLQLPEYTFEELEKGVLCGCGGFMENLSQNYFICRKCGTTEKKLSAVLRSTDEFKKLFPQERITTNKIQEWCKIINAKKTIRKYLLAKYKHVSFGTSSFFEDK